MKDVILGMNGKFVTKQYKIGLSASLMRHINDIEQITDVIIETYLGEIDDVERVEIDVTNIYIDFNVDLPYDFIMNRVAKCIDMFIKENE